MSATASSASRLFVIVAEVVMTIWFLPYRMLSRLSEMLLERPRAGRWETTLLDQIKLNTAGRFAVDQILQYELYPFAARRAVGFTRAIGIG